ncbi:beta-galactosidase [Bacillaceae bacterium S4-13-56]
MIQVKDQSIQINGEDVVLFGGELHYFRVPKTEWRNRILQAKEAGMNMISTYVPWGFHEYEEGKIDLEGKTRAERDLVTFLQIVQEENMYCLVRPGPYVMAEVVDHGVPTWFIDNYPEAVAKTQQGNIHPTRVVSYMHPTYLKKVKAWYKQVCRVIEPNQIQHGGSIILFQLDNEVGMFHWVTNQGDYNLETQKLFVDYLQKKFSLEQFNATFHVSVDSIERFATGSIADPEQPYGVAIRNEYSMFMRQHYRAYLEYVKQLAVTEGIRVPFVVNVHGFDTVDFLKRGKKYPIGLSQLAEAAKIDDVLLAGDYYIGNIEYDNYIDIVLANAFTKSIQWNEQPLFSAEFQGGSIPDKPRLQPSTFDLTTRLCIANGMNAINYYMFVGGENYENIGLLGRRHEWQAPLSATGKKKPHYKVIQHLGQMLNVYQKQLAKAKQDTNTHFAFYPEYFMTEFSNDFTKSIDQHLQREREDNIYDGVARGLRFNNIIFDGYNVQLEQKIEPKQVPTLWMFADKRMSESVQERLVNYIEDGGLLVLFPIIPTENMNGEPCTILKDYINVKVKGKKNRGFVQIDEVDSVQVISMEHYEITEGAFGWSEDENRDVVAFEKELGKGKLIMFGVSMQNDYQYKNPIYRNLAAKGGVESSFTLEDEVDISARVINDHSYFVFLNNFDEYEKITTVHYNGNLLFDGKQVTVPGKSGLMLPINIQVQPDLTVVYSTAEIVKQLISDETMVMEVAINQDQEELVFQSTKWIPTESATVKVVEDTQYKTYKVKINSRNKVENIPFYLKK